ncbi:ABC-F family ATP-binding cassette domain-containing protein [Phreatobacter stygius]|uniref:ABC-F family ATP-binding cassette domain-containing protein n=1 Tax=Phreatobacter stygius TaxID=1940610 RepID=A0A4D7B1W3_9HYPH|nr:ABC-F family ATP-binding cassette domain-containing protein [Phreatobacter stygius]QCI64040.1 ABC-F family ATP-binding cassette domain-containing protein [Phreatobacter stygius]
MSALLTLRNLSYSTPDGRELFQGLNLSLGRERYGLIGRNGVGKSTLMTLMAGALGPKTGAVLRHGSLRQLRQSVQVASGEMVADALGVSEALARLALVSAGRGGIEAMQDADWTLEARLSEAMARMDLAGIGLDRPLATLSGGQRTRLALAAILVDPPDLILLDEPTNNLDRDGRVAVARFLGEWRGGAVVVSHDRELLRHMDRMVELTSLGVTTYGGNWDLYAERKANELAAAERDLAVAERDAGEAARKAQVAAERQARKDGAGKRSRAKAGQSKLLLDARQDRAEKTLGRGNRLADRQRAAAAGALQTARAKMETVRTLAFSVGAVRLPAGKTVLAFDQVTGGPVPGRAIIHDLSFAIVGPERVAVTGPNGSGKSTLLRLATGALQPFAGSVVQARRSVMLDQQMSLLDPDRSILDNFRRLNPGCNDNACRAALARFLFRADAALRRVGELSGGEILRVGLACTLGGGDPPDLLILDEPTNHLDIASITAVEAALGGFDGALLVVSHDEDFLSAIGVTRRIVLSQASAG